MSFLDALKQDALAVLHATANALHAQLANTLSQAGHAVSEADHVDTLVKTAQAAATGAARAVAASTIAPNYADAALATFNQSMTVALIQFAQLHLPAKFQGVASDAAAIVADATSHAPTAAAIVDDVLKVTGVTISATVAGAAPAVAVIEPAAEQIVNAVFDASPSSTEPAFAAPAPPLNAMNTQGV